MTHYVSTRGDDQPCTFSAAMDRGLCTDGGLFVPESFPDRAPGAGPAQSLAECAAQVIAPFFAGDPLAASLADICTSALSFPVPLVPLVPVERDAGATSSAAVLELFHGPTAAFKDVGARFMAECLTRHEAGGRDRTVLVATSGDTGGAVAAAFWRRPGFEVVILFPSQGVSARQRHQLTCWGDNVHSFAVRGTFDDCQRLLKTALADPDWRARRRLTTANSINIARLLPQVVYYAFAGMCYLRDSGVAPDFIVPSGNVGNATAALWAKRLGYPVGTVVLATNANRAVPDYLVSGRWEPRPSRSTLANAMDVGNPSNMERVRHMYHDAASLSADVESVSVDDDAIRATIRRGVARWGRVWDPHTATAMHVLERRDAAHQIAVATAHPAKFDTVVEPLVGRAVEVPADLASLLARPARAAEIEPDLGELSAVLASS
ncbi:MAG: threonine synthase [Planctomycetota bacterium]